MFRRDVKDLNPLLYQFLRSSGLETPLLQRRLVSSWETVAGALVARHTQNIFISNQTLMVKISNTALRAELMMIRTELVRKLNGNVGANVIADIKFY